MPIADSIEAVQVPENKRMGILPKYLGMRYMMLGESLIYDCMGALCEAYDGGLWQMVELSNDAFYMRQASPDAVWMTGPNGTTKRVSADAAGLVATLYAINSLAWRSMEPKISELYHRVLQYAGVHAEAAAIKALID